MSIALLRFDAANVTPKDDAILHDFIIGSSGILSGCEVTSLGGNQLQVAAGRGLIMGRDFVVTQQTINATVSDSGTKLGRLIVEIDIENTTTPIAFKTQMASTLPDLTQEDINGDGTVYQLPLATYDISTTTVSNLASVATQLSGLVPDGSITQDKLADDSVGSDQIIDSAILSNHVSPGHVVGARFTRTSTQSIASDVFDVPIQWNSYPYNPDSSHNASYLSRMYARYAGIYTIVAKVAFASSGTSDQTSRSVTIKKNGTTILDYTIMRQYIVGAYIVCVVDCVELSVGDYIEVLVYQNSGSALNLLSGNGAPQLSIRRNIF